MILKEIELFGFKSFADKTKIKVSDGITVIVGPNGCGKSNILDAVRWVLGEQSAKSLRGGRMEDVIFNGSRNRAPLNFAEVTLVFDNKDGILRTELSEVSVTRRLFRDGESVYMINKKPCRMKDIVELFLDTGFGKNTYSIIEQGKIDAIINAKPHERRVFFEEAAGINKYRFRREEAFRKLKATQENLDRLNDILSEIEKNYNKLSRQTEKARKYRELQKELRELELKVGVYEKEQFLRRLNNLSQEIENRQNEEKELQREIEKWVERRHQLEAQLRVLEEEWHPLQENRTEIVRKIEELRGQQRLVQQKREEIQNAYERLSGEQKNEKEQLLSLNESLGNMRRVQETLSGNVENVERLLEEWRPHFIELNKMLQQGIQTEKELETKIHQTEKTLGIDEERMVFIEKRMQEIRDIGKELRTQKENLESKIAEQQKEIQAEESEMAHLQEKLSEIETVYSSVENHISKLYDERTRKELLLKQKMVERNDLIAELKYLENILKKSEEREDETVEEFCRNLSQIKELIRGIKEEKWIPTIDAFFSEVFEAYLTNNGEIEELKNGDSLWNGRVHFIGEVSRSEREEDIKTLGDILEWNCSGLNETQQKRIGNFFANVALIEERDEAQEQRLREKGYELLYHNGVYQRANGLISVGTLQQKGFLQTRNEIEELMQRLIILENKISRIEKDLRLNRERLAQFERDRKSLTHKREEVIVILKEKETKIRSRQEMFQGLKRSWEELSRREEQIRKEEEFFEKEWEQLKERISGNREDLIRWQEELRERRESLESVRRNSEVYEIAIRGMESHLEKLIQEKFYQEERIRSFENQVREKQNRLQQIAEELSRLEETRGGMGEFDWEEDFRNQERVLQNQLNHIEERIERIKQEKEEAMRVLENSTQEEEKQREALERLREEKQNLLIKTEQIRNQLQLLLQRLKETYEIDLENEKIEIGEEDWGNIRERVAEIKNSIQRLGSINFEAEEEFQELKERKEFYEEQCQDLQKACDDLTQTIQKFDVQSTQIFLENFHNIRNNFQLMFKTLFGGGEADIILTDEENVLESGVEIIAQPPGKKPQTIALLSGGEKALTALALVMGIFLVKPSPVCILDEVDAPLDEANVERFAHLIEEFSLKTQFLVITHNKRTMEVASQIYGVTQFQPGVSNILSIELKEVDQYIDESAQKKEKIA